MQRKPGFPVANCNIKIPDTIPLQESTVCDEDKDQQQRRQQLINFGHSQWGFNNWSWSVTKQDLDFVDFANGRYCAGVVAFVSVTVKSFDIHRDNIGYATSVAPMKGLAIHQARKCAVTNALRETLLSFGGGVTTELLELLETHKNELLNHNIVPANEPMHENNQNLPNRLVEPKNAPLIKNIRKDSSDSCSSTGMRPMAVNNVQPVMKNAVSSVPLVPPIAKAHPMPANLPPANRPPVPPVPAVPPAPVPHLRPNSNEAANAEECLEEDARAERKRRQRQAQEEFRLKQLMKQNASDDEQELNKNSCTFDNLLTEIPTQDIVMINSNTEAVKRPASPHFSTTPKRKANVTRLHNLLNVD